MGPCIDGMQRCWWRPGRSQAVGRVFALCNQTLGFSVTATSALRTLRVMRALQLSYALYTRDLALTQAAPRASTWRAVLPITCTRRPPKKRTTWPHSLLLPGCTPASCPALPQKAAATNHTQSWGVHAAQASSSYARERPPSISSVEHARDTLTGPAPLYPCTYPAPLGNRSVPSSHHPQPPRQLLLGWAPGLEPRAALPSTSSRAQCSPLHAQPKPLTTLRAPAHGPDIFAVSPLPSKGRTVGGGRSQPLLRPAGRRAASSTETPVRASPPGSPRDLQQRCWLGTAPIPPASKAESPPRPASACGR